MPSNEPRGGMVRLFAVKDGQPSPVWVRFQRGSGRDTDPFVLGADWDEVQSLRDDIAPLNAIRQAFRKKLTAGIALVGVALLTGGSASSLIELLYGALTGK